MYTSFMSQDSLVKLKCDTWPCDMYPSFMWQGSLVNKVTGCRLNGFSLVPVRVGIFLFLITGLT